jgi:NADPH-dependent ferric siderophore reductase
MHMMTNQTSTTSRSGRRRARVPTQLWQVPVLRVDRVTPRLARVTVGGDELAGFTHQGTDSHVKLYFYGPGADLPRPLTLEAARTLFSTYRPSMRSYTVRRHDPVRGELDIDFVLHGEHEGPAATWARHAGPGDELILVGPSPAYRPNPDAGCHLLAGDETALPAIAAILDELGGQARVRVYAEVENAGERQDLPGSPNVHWVHREDGGPSLADAVRAARLPAGDLEAWVAGERESVRDIRAYLLDELRLPRHRVRPTSYWRHGFTEDGPPA